MKPQYPNVAKVELVAQALGDLRERLVFVGGCAVDLLLTDAAAAPSRVTYDVDLVAQVTALAGYHELEKSLPSWVSGGICPGMRLSAAGVWAIWRWT